MGWIPKSTDNSYWKYDEQLKGIQLPNYVFKMVRLTGEANKGKVGFKVPLTMNKFMIKNYLEELYGVKVKSVHTAIYLGKTKHLQWGRVRWSKKMPDYKKAIVDIEGGFKMPTLEEAAKMTSASK
eukprot:g55893.t1